MVVCVNVCALPTVMLTEESKRVTFNANKLYCYYHLNRVLVISFSTHIQPESSILPIK